MRFQDTTQGGAMDYGVGVKFPNYMQNPRAGQSQTSGGGNPQSWADRNRANFAKSIGADSFTGDDGRLDYAKMLNSAKAFCV